LLTESHVRRDGFSLVEVLVAMAVLLTGVALAAPALVAAILVNRDARQTEAATALAVGKVEELRTLASVDSRLTPSPAGTVDEDVAGYFDEAEGWVRRWSIARLTPDTTDALLIEVVVVPSSARRSPVRNARGVVRMSAVRRPSPP
jgi:prepilin-type N-terminal cleavage/methylation domain-containing protein